MDFSKEASIVETVLFLEGEPLDMTSLVRVTQLSREAVTEAIRVLKEEYQRPSHGVELIEMGGGFSLSPKREMWEPLRGRYGRRSDRRLSRAALETLAIVAYSQPVTKAEVESIRGVSADGMLRLLSERGLIETGGKKDVPGKPVQFRTTREFLRLFRLASIADLPKLDEMDEDRFAPDE